MTLSVENIKCELSYAYLHAIASRGGFSCFAGNRHEDNAGVDARVSAHGPHLDHKSTLMDFTLHVQLKATARRRRCPRARPHHFPFDLEVKHYDKLRNEKVESQRILAVLYLPDQDKKWLSHLEDGMVSRRCLYWVSLCGAPPSANSTSQVVYIPKANVLTVDTLRDLMVQLSREERLIYAG